MYTTRPDEEPRGEGGPTPPTPAMALDTGPAPLSAVSCTPLCVVGEVAPLFNIIVSYLSPNPVVHYDNTELDLYAVELVVPHSPATTGLPTSRLRAETQQRFFDCVDGAERYLYALLAAGNCRPIIRSPDMENARSRGGERLSACLPLLNQPGSVSEPSEPLSPTFVLNALDPPIAITWIGLPPPQEVSSALAHWTEVWLKVLSEESTSLGLRIEDVARHLAEVMGTPKHMGGMASEVVATGSFSGVIDGVIAASANGDKHHLEFALLRADPVAAVCAMAAHEISLLSPTPPSPFVPSLPRLLEGPSADHFLTCWKHIGSAFDSLNRSFDELGRKVGMNGHAHGDLLTAWRADLAQLLVDTVFLATEATYREHNHQGPVLLELSAENLTDDHDTRVVLAWAALGNEADDATLFPNLSAPPRIPVGVSCADVIAFAAFLENYCSQLERALALPHKFVGDAARFKCHFGNALTLIGTPRPTATSQARVSLLPEWPEHRGFDIRVDMEPRRGATLDFGSVTPTDTFEHLLNVAEELVLSVCSGAFNHSDRHLMRGRGGLDRVKTACALAAAITETGLRTGTRDGSSYLHHIRSEVHRLRLNHSGFAERIDGIGAGLKRSAVR